MAPMRTMPRDASSGTSVACDGDTAKNDASMLAAKDIEGYMHEAMSIPVSQEQEEPLTKFFVRTLNAVKNEKVDDNEIRLDDEGESLRAVIQKGNIPARSSFDSKFRREVKPGTPQHDEYKTLRTAAEKQKFKLEWAEKLLDAKVEKAKTFNKELVTTQRCKGKMLTFGALVVEYGGWEWPPAVEGAKRTAAKCARLGGKWCEVDHFSELLLFRKIDKEDEEEFKRSWGLLIRSGSVTDSAGNDAASSSTTTTTATVPPQAGTGKDDKTTPGQKPGSNENEHAKDDKKRKRGSSEGGVEGQPQPKVTALTSASKFRPLFLKVVQGAELLIKQIEGSDQYKWARGSELEELKEKLQLAEQGKTLILDEFLVGTDVKASYPAKQVDECLAAFLDRKKIIDEVGAKTKEITEMHRVKQALTRK